MQVHHRNIYEIYSTPQKHPNTQILTIYLKHSYYFYSGEGKQLKTEKKLCLEILLYVFHIWYERHIYDLIYDM